MYNIIIFYLNFVIQLVSTIINYNIKFGYKSKYIRYKIENR